MSPPTFSMMTGVFMALIRSSFASLKFITSFEMKRDGVAKTAKTMVISFLSAVSFDSSSLTQLAGILT